MLLGPDGGKIEIEQNSIFGKVKTLTCYFGDYLYNQGYDLKVEYDALEYSADCSNEQSESGKSADVFGGVYDDDELETFG